jgi:hypothetical protein
MQILNTEVVLPGMGTKVLDLDLKLSGSVTFDGVVQGRGGVFNPNPLSKSSSCDWHNTSPPVTTPPRYTHNQEVEYQVDVTIDVPTPSGYVTIGGLNAVARAPLQAAQTPITIGSDCRHLSYAEWDFPAEFRTMPIQYRSDTPITINIVSHITFHNGVTAIYAGLPPTTETMYVETMIDRLSVRVN